jgi:hypothetical protein
VRIYIAARYARIAEMWDIRTRLQNAGHTVTSSWLSGRHEENEASALLDLADIDSSEVVMVFTDPRGSKNSGGGRWFEAGYAYGRHKKIIFVGEPEIIFCHLRIRLFADLTAAIAYLGDP